MLLTVALALMLVGSLQAQGSKDAGYFRLPELAIDAEKAQIARMLKDSHEQIASDTIKLRPVLSPNEHLRLNSSISLPGSLKGMGGAPSLRGFPNYSNQVLIDGTPVTMPWGNWANVTIFPMRRLQNISIVKSGAALLYGASGMAGAINMTLPSAYDLEGLRMVQEMGEYGTRHQEFTYGHVADNSEHLFGLFSDISRGHLPHSALHNETFMYRGSIDAADGWHFRVGVMEFRGERELPDIGDPTMRPQEWSRWDISHRDFVAEKDLGADRNLSLRIYRNSEYSLIKDFDDFTYSKVVDSNDGEMTVDGQEVLYNTPAGNNHYLTFALQRKVDKQGGASVGDVDRRLETKGAYISDSYKANRKLNLHLLARVDKHSTAGSENSWSATADYELDDQHSLRLAGSRTLRFPAMRELYMTFIGKQKPDGTWVGTVPGQGLTANKAEIAKNIEAHYTYKPTKDWKLSVGRFVSHVEGLIDRVFNANWPNTRPRFVWRNLAEVDIKGWESRVEGTINSKFSTWLGYTRLEKSDDVSTGLRLDERPSYRLVGGLVYRQDKNSAMLVAEKVGESKYVAFGKGATLETSLKSYTRFDLSFRRELTDMAAIYLNVENLTDEKIEAHGSIIGVAPVTDSPRKALLGLECRF